MFAGFGLSRAGNAAAKMGMMSVPIVFMGVGAILYFIGKRAARKCVEQGDGETDAGGEVLRSELLSTSVSY